MTITPRLHAATLLTAAVLALAPLAARAEPGETRGQVGLTAASGMSDLRDKLEQNNAGLKVSQLLPVGLFAAVSHEFGGGMAVGGSIGPVILGRGDVSFTIVPLALDVRYHFGGGSSTYYGRLGVEKALASGDLLESSSAGAVVGFGVEFHAPRQTGWGLELAFHGSKVVVKAGNGHAAQDAKPYQGTLSAFFSF